MNETAIVAQLDPAEWPHVGPWDIRRYITGPALDPPIVDLSRWWVYREWSARVGPGAGPGDAFETVSCHTMGTVRGLAVPPSSMPDAAQRYAVELDGSPGVYLSVPAVLLRPETVPDEAITGGVGGIEPPF